MFQTRNTEWANTPKIILRAQKEAGNKTDPLIKHGMNNEQYELETLLALQMRKKVDEWT